MKRRDDEKERRVRMEGIFIHAKEPASRRRNLSAESGR